MSDTDKIDQLFTAIFAASDNRQEGITRAFDALKSREGWLAKVTMVTYRCARGCQVATVFRAGGATLCSVRGYKFTPAMNARMSVAEARKTNTVDGHRVWPPHVYDVNELAGWGAEAGMSVNCAHFIGTLNASEVLATVESVLPGKAIKPVVLGAI
jgi:hypothetical protein